MPATTPSAVEGAPFPAGININRDPQALQAFVSDQSGRVGQAPLAIASPSSAEQVQSVLRWATQSKIAIVPISSKGGPRRRGDTICEQPAVILDLSGMNKVIHVDGRDAIAVIEPGVTFGELNAALAPHGLRSFRPLELRPSKSVLAAFLEREPITVPSSHWDSADPLAAMEFVFGNGDMFRTGGAALPGTLEQNLARGNRQMLGAGPMHTDFGRVIQGAQGALGVVTWASIYCQRVPTLAKPLFAHSTRLESIVELAYRMLRRRTAAQLFIVNARQLALSLAGERLVDKLAPQLPDWTMYVELAAPEYFPQEAIAYQLADLKRDASALGVTIGDRVGEFPASAVAKRQDADLTSAAANAGFPRQEVFCISQLDRVRGHLDAISPSDAAQACIYVQPLAQGVNAHCQFTLIDEAKQGSAAAHRATALAEALAGSGGFFSRPYHPWAHIPFQRDKSIAPLLAKTKSLFDPFSVLQPGAQSLGGAL